MALAGMVVTLMLSAFTERCSFSMKMKQLVYFWGAGSLIQNNWDGVQFAFPFIIISFLVLLFISRKLNILLLGDDVAVSLGEKTAVTRLIAFIAAIF